MFIKIAIFALVTPLVSALQISTPTDAASSSPVTITWTNSAGDPSTFSLELVNTVFHNSFAIANNVLPTSGSITVTLPVVPVGDGYTVEAVNIGNITQVYATSGGFSIGPQTSGSASSTSSASGSSGSVGSVSTTPSTSGFGTTVTTPPAATSASSGSASTPTSSPFNGGVSSLRFSLSSCYGAFAVMLFSAVAGAAFVV